MKSTETSERSEGAKSGSTVETLPVVHTSSCIDPKDVCVFSNMVRTSSGAPVSLRWYASWIRQRLDTSPAHIFSSLPGGAEGGLENPTLRLEALWRAVAVHLKSQEYTTIRAIVDGAISQGLVVLDEANEDASRRSICALIFTVIGWQTMLYTADLESCPPSQLAISDDLDGFQGQARMALKQNQTAYRRPLHEFLIGFGVLLPPRNFSAYDDPRDKKAFQEVKSVQPACLNAHLLVYLARTKIRWVDSLSAHLELDQAANVLYLFKYPSFCIACRRLDQSPDKIHNSVLHGCAAPDRVARQWATAEEIDQTLHEIFLSYRLLFGQTKKSRRLFRKLSPFASMSRDETDTVLENLCGAKHCDWADADIDSNVQYSLVRDFPILRSRLANLQHHLAAQKPRAWTQLWQDKRDSAQWFTFWAVVVIGGLGILLAFIQVVLQAIQIGLQARN